MKMHDLTRIAGTAEKLSRLLAKDEEKTPIELKVYKNKPPGREDWPGLTSKPGFWEVEESKSKPLAKAMTQLMQAYYRARDIEAEMKAERVKAESEIREKHQVELDESKGKLPVYSREVWKIVEKNRGVIKEGEAQAMRLLQMVVELQAQKTIEAPEPEPLPEDPRVEAAIRWVASNVPNLLKQFMTVLDEAERQFLQSTKEEPRQTPPKLTIQNPTNKAPETASMDSATMRKAFDLVEWLQSLWGKLKSAVQGLQKGADELEELMP